MLREGAKYGDFLGEVVAFDCRCGSCFIHGAIWTQDDVMDSRPPLPARTVGKSSDSSCSAGLALS